MMSPNAYHLPSHVFNIQVVQQKGTDFVQIDSRDRNNKKISRDCFRTMKCG